MRHSPLSAIDGHVTRILSSNYEKFSSICFVCDCPLLSYKTLRLKNKSSLLHFICLQLSLFLLVLDKIYLPRTSADTEIGNREEMPIVTQWKQRTIKLASRRKRTFGKSLENRLPDFLAHFYNQFKS